MIYIRDTSSPRGRHGRHGRGAEPDGMRPAPRAVEVSNSPQVSRGHQGPEVVVQAFPALSQSSDP